MSTCERTACKGSQLEECCKWALFKLVALSAWQEEQRDTVCMDLLVFLPPESTTHSSGEQPGTVHKWSPLLMCRYWNLHTDRGVAQTSLSWNNLTENKLHVEKTDMIYGKCTSDPTPPLKKSGTNNVLYVHVVNDIQNTGTFYYM